MAHDRSHDRRQARARLVARAARATVVGIALLVPPVRTALADPTVGNEAGVPAWGSTRSLLQRFGVDAARRLLHGGDSADAASVRAEALRGIDRALGLGTPERIGLLVQLLTDTRGLARADTTVLLATTRALAPFAREHAVARALADAVLNVPGLHPPARSGPASDASLRVRDPDRRARLELARDTAALALAEAREEQATDVLLAAARRAGPGQAAATRALAAFPPEAFSAPPVVTPEALALAGALDDWRAADMAVEATRSIDRAVRTAALRALGSLGDPRAVAVAEAALEDAESDPRLREAATRALVLLGAKSAAKAVQRLLEDDRTAEAGAELSRLVGGDEVTGALAARVRVSSDGRLRHAAIVALGFQSDPQALALLSDLLADPLLCGDAAEAIARSKVPAAWETIARALGQPSTRRMGARMAALRGRVTGGTPESVRRALGALAVGTEPGDRAVASAALVLLGTPLPGSSLGDPDVRVRRAVATALEPTSPAYAAAMEARLQVEDDDATRRVLARQLALAGPGRATATSTTELVERLRAGDIDAPMAALELARHYDDADRAAAETALGSPNPLVRSHTARGLGESSRPWAVGLLANAYLTEVDPGTRRAITLALASRVSDASAPLRADTLERAAHFDPEASIRTIAARASEGLPPPELPRSGEVVWLRVMTASGAAPPAPPIRGVLVRADGLAIPVVFDEEGYALVPSGPGPARLVLAPRLGAYEAAAHGE